MHFPPGRRFLTGHRDDAFSFRGAFVFVVICYCSAERQGVGCNAGNETFGVKSPGQCASVRAMTYEFRLKSAETGALEREDRIRILVKITTVEHGYFGEPGAGTAPRDKLHYKRCCASKSDGRGKGDILTIGPELLAILTTTVPNWGILEVG